MRLAAVNEVPPGHNTNPPVLIHCSEGGGRAGLALAADLLLYTLDHNQVNATRISISILMLIFRFAGFGHTSSREPIEASTRQSDTVISSI